MQIYNLSSPHTSKYSLFQCVIVLVILGLISMIYCCQDDRDQVEFWKKYIFKHQHAEIKDYSIQLKLIQDVMSFLIKHPYQSIEIQKIIFSEDSVGLIGKTSSEFNFVLFFKTLKQGPFSKNIELSKWQSQQKSNYQFSIKIG